MLRSFAAILLATTAMAGCGGGSSTNGDPGPASLTPEEQGIRLRGDIAAGSANVESPLGPSLSDATASFTVDRNFNISVNINAGETLTFTDADVVAAGNAGITQFINDGNRDLLIFALPSGSAAGSADGNLDYTAFGIWVNDASADLTTAAGTFTAADAGATFLGVPTADGDMPLAGSATYRGAAMGFAATGTTILDVLNGNLSAAANFATNTLNTTLTLNGNSGAPFAQIDAAGVPITGNDFATAAGGATSDQGHVGTLNGTFFGPAANEIGGVFDLDSADNRIFGSFAGAAE